MQKADLVIDLSSDLWEIIPTLKTIHWFIISILLHIAIGATFGWVSVENIDQPTEIVDLTLSQATAPLGAKSRFVRPSGKSKQPTPAIPAANESSNTTNTSTTTAESDNGGGGDSAISGEGPVGWGEVTQFPKVSREIKATYPEEAKAAGVDGPVVMEILIDRTGKVRDVKVVSGPGYGLNESAVNAIKQFEFTPALKETSAVAVKIRYTYRFKLGVN